MSFPKTEQIVFNIAAVLGWIRPFSEMLTRHQEVTLRSQLQAPGARQLSLLLSSATFTNIAHESSHTFFHVGTRSHPFAHISVHISTTKPEIWGAYVGAPQI